MEPTRANVVVAARAYLGVCFVHKGRSLSGLDCIGLLWCVARDLGQVLSDNLDYPKLPPSGYIRRELFKRLNTKPKDTADIQMGDIVLMRNPAQEIHVGILGEYKGQLTLIHMHQDTPTRGKVVEHTLEGQRHLIHLAVTFPGVQD